ncbi:hypothetical protein OsI_18174 [Oryza sativa Indica Group]|uniref:ENTH domain-containing protein n=1 Tax=Oryza sativa subsp. indica TaxID=39946 RepID=B8AXC6_ORYSI|nr:hypothetical protein OsI_18174 [Oryza sativa Indica Group]
MSIRKALGAVKDQTSIGIAKVSAAIAPELDVAIVRATSHEDAPAEDRHVREVVTLTAHSRPYTAACAASLSRRLSRTRDYVVAAKCLALAHRLVADGDPHFRHELVRPAGRRGAPMLALLAEFRDEAHSASWDHSAFVRAYALYLDHRARFLISLLPAPRTVRFADETGSPPRGSTAATVQEMDTEALLGRALQAPPAARPRPRVPPIRRREAKPASCSPRSTRWSRRARSSAPDSQHVVLAVLLDRFFDMDYPDCVKRIDDKLLETLEQFVRERGRAGHSSPPPWQQQTAQSDELDMNGINGCSRCLEHHAAEPSRSAPEKVCTRTNGCRRRRRRRRRLATSSTSGNPWWKTSRRTSSRLALFSGTENGGWVAFPSDDAAEVTSAWQTPAAEAGKAEWELALVETASKLSRQKASMGGGLDPLLLHGMYDQGAVRQQVGAHAAATGSASSVAAPRRAPVLALPAPDGTARTTGGDPFAASLGVPPPAYVQMAEMERKQQLLVQEQQMWAQYRQGGMQGQVAMDRLAAGAMPVQYGMPMASAYGGYY